MVFQRSMKVKQRFARYVQKFLNSILFSQRTQNLYSAQSKFNVCLSSEFHHNFLNWINGGFGSSRFSFLSVLCPYTKACESIGPIQQISRWIRLPSDTSVSHKKIIVPLLLDIRL